MPTNKSGTQSKGKEGGGGGNQTDQGHEIKQPPNSELPLRGHLS